MERRGRPKRSAGALLPPQSFILESKTLEGKRETEEAVEREDNRRIGKKYKAGFGNSPLGRWLLQQVCFLMQL